MEGIAMVRTPFELEVYAHYVMERATADAARRQRLAQATPGRRASSTRVRVGLGRALVAVGVRLGGPAPAAPAPTASRANARLVPVAFGRALAPDRAARPALTLATCEQTSVGATEPWPAA
jgi:hypothetical protein